MGIVYYLLRLALAQTLSWYVQLTWMSGNFRLWTNPNCLYEMHYFNVSFSRFFFCRGRLKFCLWNKNVSRYPFHFISSLAPLLNQIKRYKPQKAKLLKCTRGTHPSMFVAFNVTWITWVQENVTFLRSIIIWLQTVSRPFDFNTFVSGKRCRCIEQWQSVVRIIK